MKDYNSIQKMLYESYLQQQDENKKNQIAQEIFFNHLRHSRTNQTPALDATLSAEKKDVKVNDSSDARLNILTSNIQTNAKQPPKQDAATFTCEKITSENIDKYCTAKHAHTGSRVNLKDLVNAMSPEKREGFFKLLNNVAQGLLQARVKEAGLELEIKDEGNKVQYNLKQKNGAPATTDDLVNYYKKTGVVPTKETVKAIYDDSQKVQQKTQQASMATNSTPMTPSTQANKSILGQMRPASLEQSKSETKSHESNESMSKLSK